ncbi:PsiF family protein [Agrobacterium sp. SHOUNA12C]|uniref:PsiF repeat-containing protein n=1 Tax=Rhizobium rhizogenes NBRC 13257 TaxID=1220581 RepID=A0AA87Q5G6_RHIRH|nr:PsiF family protein [Rhizobium rhizogenes]KAA6489628.1 hypothetical protein DXT98_04370 [Agrobacterium sp. ICMP 7243]MCJ9721968.1 PsiF family protein [Agrobacterium sp. BETTINA12B]MCJ9756536.1 PsiF family protein [Agrobacterium sp. SHOUNA12C]NTF48499.1 hypothetical protein [Rhizobium rhizogenes]NTF55193.1 hypothetical protein [Rhizobium rhizogenes]
MRFVKTFTAAAIVALISANAMAQTATPSTTTTTPATTTTAPAATAKTTATATKQKAAKPAQTEVSKACSAQADAKGLHGKERSKFRSQCKKNGGKV